MNKEESLKQIAFAINKYQSFAIYSHINTDFDAVASSLCFKRIVESLGKVGHIFINSELPSNAFLLDGSEKINNEKQASYQVAVVLDCGNESRLGKFNYRYKKGTLASINIDHHTGTLPFGTYNYLVPGASSTCELLFDLMQFMRLEIDEVCAKLLISGIYTDTGSLQYSSSHPSTYKCVSKLLKAYGETIDKIVNPIYNSLSVPAFRLREICYQKTELFFDNRVAVTMLEASDFKRAGAVFKDTEGLATIALQIASVKLLALMSEDPEEPGTFRISFRSKDGYRANNVAFAFGGGGHLQASACKICDTAENVKKKVLAELEKEINRL